MADEGYIRLKKSQAQCLQSILLSFVYLISTSQAVFQDTFESVSSQSCLIKLRKYSKRVRVVRALPTNIALVYHAVTLSVFTPVISNWLEHQVSPNSGSGKNSNQPAHALGAERFS